jgi:hypothetical protein
VTAAAAPVGTAAGEEGIAAGHRVQEEGRHRAAGRRAAGMEAAVGEGLGCSRIVACTLISPCIECRVLRICLLLLVTSTVSASM